MSPEPKTEGSYQVNNPENTKRAMELISMTFNTNGISLIDGMTALVMTLAHVMQDNLAPGATMETAMKELTDQAIQQLKDHHIIAKKMEDGLGIFDASFSKGTVN